MEQGEIRVCSAKSQSRMPGIRKLNLTISDAGMPRLVADFCVPIAGALIGATLTTNLVLP
jgi:hypothetical protein